MPVFNHRHIAHLDLDTFFVSVEQLYNPKLIGKPVLIGGGNDRGVVAACSYEARKFGIHSAMPMYKAKRLCKEAIVVRGDYEAYSKKSLEVTQIISNSVPLFEKASIDEFYIDLTGMDRWYGVNKFTGELKTKVNRESGLPVSWGLASNKLVSKIATNEVKPNGQLEIPFGNEKGFLSPLSIFKIPGVGEKTGMRLVKMGIEKIQTLAAMKVEQVESAFGKNGSELWRRANGIDESVVVPYSEQKSISTEDTFQADTIDINFLEAKLVRMTESIAYELRSQNRLTGCITVKIRYTDFETHTMQKAIFYTNADHILIKLAKELFHKLYTRRILIRLIGVRFTNLIPGTHQVNLFEDTQEMISLYKAIDSVKKRYGENLIMRAKSLFTNK
jgi:DNA polymerase IV